jgi:hypothetical protein
VIFGKKTMKKEQIKKSKSSNYLLEDVRENDNDNNGDVRELTVD